MKSSWKTTLLGVFALLGAICAAGTALLDGNPETAPDFASILSGLTGLGLIFARDNDVSSEDAGAK
jgi:hypothetical protein